ncbi:MAG: hypothetical protein HYX86_01565 [Chloroflexi bacterium]|nr:hypothetical protein [Chloroflexota bacterium]
MKIRRVLLVLFLGALGAISVASVALGNTESGPRANVSPDHLGSYFLSTYCSGGEFFREKVTFWWTRNGVRVGPKVTAECSSDDGEVYSDTFAIPHGVTDYHFRVRVWNTDSGESSVCKSGQRFPEEVLPDGGGYSSYGYCYLSDGDRGGWWIYYD